MPSAEHWSTADNERGHHRCEYQHEKSGIGDGCLFQKENPFCNLQSKI